MSVKTLLGEAAVVLHAVRDLDGDPVTGQAGSISTSLFDPAGASSALSVTVAEIGSSGWYTLTVTPTSAGLWRLQATGDAALGRAVPDAPNPAFVDYTLSVHATGIETTGNLLGTLAVLKRRLGITDSAFDTVLNDILAEVSARMQDEIGHAVLQASYTDYHDGSGADTLLLRQGPLVSVASLNRVGYEDDGGGGRSEVLTAVDEYQRLEGGLLSEGHLGVGWVRFVSGRVFDCGRRNWRVAYTAGFSAAPILLSHACIVESVRQFNIREAHGLRGKTTGDDSLDPVPSAAADAALLRAMRPYMAVGVG